MQLDDYKRKWIIFKQNTSSPPSFHDFHCILPVDCPFKVSHFDQPSSVSCPAPHPWWTFYFNQGWSSFYWWNVGGGHFVSCSPDSIGIGFVLSLSHPTSKFLEHFSLGPRFTETWHHSLLTYQSSFTCKVVMIFEILDCREKSFYEK